MRVLFCLSSLLNSRSASAENSILQTMTLQYVFQRNRGFFSAADTFESVFRQVDVLKIFKMLQDGFANVEGLGAPGAPGEFFKASFDGLRKADGQHDSLAIQV